MATLTELHRETKKVVRQALIEGSVSITEHGSLVARIEPDYPTVVLEPDEFWSLEMSGEAIAEAVNRAREERDASLP